MYRYEIEKMYTWKNKKNKKPLIIEGARQVGKTWLMKKFGEVAYENTVYINFDNNTYMKNLFSLDLDINRIILGIETYVECKIDSSNTLLIFDEIQEVSKALSSLKYFCENAPEYDIVCAGSLLGIALHQGTSFPVGKVEFLNLYPLSFNEFLLALDKKDLVELLDNADYDLVNVFSDKYIELLKQYYYVGGMPEAVKCFEEEKDFMKVREIQNRILKAYEQDFSKHAPSEIVPQIRMVWNSIPSQLAKENKKFMYGHIRQGARAKDFEMAIMWLIDCGLIHKIYRATIPNIPLKAYADLNVFKLYTLDVGLLSALNGIRPKILLQGDECFKEFKGALTECFVCSQLKTVNDIDAYYYSNERSNAEIDFILDNGEHIIPVEVKSRYKFKSKKFKTVYRKVWS